MTDEELLDAVEAKVLFAMLQGCAMDDPLGRNDAVLNTEPPERLADLPDNLLTVDDCRAGAYVAVD